MAIISAMPLDSQRLLHQYCLSWEFWKSNLKVRPSGQGLEEMVKRQLFSLEWGHLSVTPPDPTLVTGSLGNRDAACQGCDSSPASSAVICSTLPPIGISPWNVFTRISRWTCCKPTSVLSCFPSQCREPRPHGWECWMLHSPLLLSPPPLGIQSPASLI